MLPDAMEMYSGSRCLWNFEVSFPEMEIEKIQELTSTGKKKVLYQGKLKVTCKDMYKAFLIKGKIMRGNKADEAFIYQE